MIDDQLIAKIKKISCFGVVPVRIPFEIVQYGFDADVAAVLSFPTATTINNLDGEYEIERSTSYV